MDNIFNKFGIYDFIGIWGPGAIAITYDIFSLPWLINWVLDELSLTKYNLPPIYYIVIVYIAFAYTTGVILHEVGKLIFDRLPLFDFERITYFSKDNVKKDTISPFSRIRYDYNRSIDSIDKNGVPMNKIFSQNTPISFEKARAYTKNNKEISLKRINSYHSVYGFSRSLFLTFLFHFPLAMVFMIMKRTMFSICFLFLDVILGALFFCRSYRYFVLWIKNIYIQYFLSIYTNDVSTENSSITSKTHIECDEEDK